MFSAASEQQRAETTRLRRVAVEVIAEKGLKPRLADFKGAQPDFAIKCKTEHREVDPDRRNFDV